MNRRRWVTGAAASVATLAALAHGQPARAQSAVADRAIDIDVQSRRLTSFNRVFATAPGRLTFRGGLVLTSSDRNFGGLSGLIMDGDGRRFLSVTDAGHWVSGSLQYEGAAPVGITQARLGPILAQSGRSVSRRRDRDAEAITLLEGTLQRGTALVSFERNHRIGRFPIVGGALGAPLSYLRLPAEAKAMRSNMGIEAVTVVAGGALRGAIVALCEQFPGDPATHVGWIWGTGADPVRFTLPNRDGFELTDIASLPDGSLVLLERRFRWFEGIKMRLRLFNPGEIAPGQSAPPGEVLLQADMTSEIDNMEGVSVHRTGRGETILTLVSDDNFNPVLQRTILLQFSLV